MTVGKIYGTSLLKYTEPWIISIGVAVVEIYTMWVKRLSGHVFDEVQDIMWEPPVR